jgi:hypothetical protein
MCGHFAQFHSREEFLAALASDMPICSAGDWHARYKGSAWKTENILR